MAEESIPKAKPRSWGTALYGALCLGSLAGILMKIVPMFGQVFRQVKVPMPATTLFLMRLSDAVCAVPWLVYPMVVLLPIGLSRLEKSRASVAQTAISIGFALSAVGILVSLFMPLMSLDYGIGARRH
jgi:type II secretory pathway component PulF